MPFIPIINQDTEELWKRFNEKIEEPKSQRRIILFIVCVALLLDNMLYMVIVPIIPDYLREIGAWETHVENAEIEYRNISNKFVPFRIGGTTVYEGEDSAVGMLFASKAIVQLFVNPFSGAIIDRIGYDIPMMIGLGVMFFSTAVFACGQSYGVLFLARSLQGVGSAFADTSGLAMIADRFTEENERQRALAIALAFISFGSLVAPPFGGILYQIAGKEVPFIILSLVCLIDAFLLKFVMQPTKEIQQECSSVEKPAGTPIHTLLMDPYICCCAGALIMANVSLAFLEPTISLWMEDTMHVEEWQMGLVWLPAFFPHVLGVYSTVTLVEKYPRYQWFFAAFGLALEGICSFILPFSKSFWFLILPISGICYGIALVDTSLLPALGYLVDLRYVSVYGSIYAIADISYSVAYAIGPIIAGSIVESIGFTALNVCIALSNLLYVPVLASLRHVYDYEQFEPENIGMTEQTIPSQRPYGQQSGQRLIMTGQSQQQQQQQRQQQQSSYVTFNNNNYSSTNEMNRNMMMTMSGQNQQYQQQQQQQTTIQ
ncbi:vesicular acetylcholine transporter-like protein [Dermatophagoides farinae]|uniref:Vesicular acetylcholine transporter-like protein n=1 Tax=Dermatophagoides farinae TaxID=6954 RepID=A0A9D4NTT1_DERFA|nr:vesicular acetylcholine transporter-like protein [Dermatophagoides farinae]